MESAIIFILGLILGSFLNVCIFRIPKGKSIVYPPSCCMKCGTRIPSYYLIPVLGYMLSHGKCFSCNKKISIQYPLIEIAAGIIAIIMYFQAASIIDFIIYYNLFMVLLAITVVDLEKMIIPDQFIMYLLICAIPYILFYSLWSNIIAALVLGLIFYLIALISKGGMGGGDIKLSFIMGLYLGLRLGTLAIFFAFLVGGLIGIIILSLGGSKKRAIPFAPFLVLGTTIAYLYGEPIISWYLRFLGM